MDLHTSPSSLISFELGVLDPGEREGVSQHLGQCPSCSARLEEVRSEMSAIATDLHAGIDERHHPPSFLLVEYAEAPSVVGAENAAQIEGHLDRCARCSDELERIRLSTEAAWKRPMPGRILPLPRRLLRREVFGPSLITAAIAVALVLVFFPPRSSESPEPGFRVGTPLRLLGSRAAGEGPLPVATVTDGNLFLFIKTAAPLDPLVRYEMIFRGVSGVELKRPLAGSAFDKVGTLGIMIGGSSFADGERIELTIVRPDRTGEPPVFADVFVVNRAAASP